MTGDSGLQGAGPDLVRGALQDDQALPGTAGFAGAVDGRLVRDVLGREPLFLDRETGEWAFDPAKFPDASPFPAGSVLDTDAEDPRRVWRLPDPAPESDHDEAVAAVERAIRSVPVPDRCPVAFSGGVDSGVVAALIDGPLYVVGFPDSHDVERARRGAEAMDREADLRVVELDHATLESAVPEVVCATGRTNAMDVSIAIPLYLAARRAAADGHDRIAVGQGADELFGGYAKVARAPDDPRVEADTVRGATREVIDSLPDQAARDVPAIRAGGVEPVAPLLHDRVVGAALPLPGELLVSGDERKVAFRRAAGEFVPDSVATRDKKAVQYGSLVSRELDRLARQAGFKRRMDDHVSKYVESLVE